MDPNACLRETQRLAAAVLARYYSGGDVPPEEAADLAEHVQSLDRWLSMGGFPPEPWQHQKEGAQ